MLCIATLLVGGVCAPASFNDSGASSSALRFLPAETASGVGDFEALIVVCNAIGVPAYFGGVPPLEESAISGVPNLLPPAPTSLRNLAAKLLDEAISAWQVACMILPIVTSEHGEGL